MADTENRGQVLFVMMTNRPDKLDSDIKRPGRLDRKIPFFYCETAAERVQVLVASPALLARTQMPQTPVSLSGLPSLALGSQLGITQTWDLHGPEGAQAAVRHQPRLVSSSMPALCDAAVAGAGIVQLPLMMVQAQLASGQLTHVLPGWAPRPEIIHAVFASRRGLLPAVRALLDFLAEQFSAAPGDQGP